MKQNLTKEFNLIVTSLEIFSNGIQSKLDNIDNINWYDKVEIIRTVIKKIEVCEEAINVVYKVPQLTDYKENFELQHYSKHTAAICSTFEEPFLTKTPVFID